MRNITLSSHHYASKWTVPKENELNDRKVINQKAIDYANLPDGAAKEALLLELLQAFHPIINKYLIMILRGSLPTGKLASSKDARDMLRNFVPKGRPINQATLLAACRTLHLAFKQMDADEVYDTLSMCLMKAVRRYDPNYSVRVRDVYEVIRAKLSRRKQFAAADVNPHLAFDSTSYLRLLARKSFLASVLGPKRQLLGYKKGPAWPPPKTFLEAGPVGFTYFVQLWFRYYVHEYITGKMSEIEAKEGVMQLEHRSSSSTVDSGDMGAIEDLDYGIPHADGNLVTAQGYAWAADLQLIKLPLDVSQMTSEWVKSTNDKLFKTMTVEERSLLYCIYVEEYNWKQCAAYINRDVQYTKKLYEEIMQYLRSKAAAKTPRKGLLR